ncbi:MAG: LacI family transcriptional regulator [Defluviitaleaceae bacterium]|nr:LacI family transcriptional regulator [Defluviitaleaceae bacterium]MCL2274469.1 LacI family transcriptional regulator [Defluviitaleaceae bacterium]
MITLKDIAREAGVSVTTVSNVVHNKGGRVSPALSRQINKIMTRNNYVPSLAARALSSKVAPIIGVLNHVVPQNGDGFVTDPFHNLFIDSIETSTRERGYFTMVRSVKDARDLATVCKTWRLAGVILVGLSAGEFFDAVRALGIPFVLIDSYITAEGVCNVGLEDMHGGYLATKHLLEHRHRAIAFAAPSMGEDDVIARRLRGYKQALAEFGVPFDAGRVYESELHVSAGTQLGHELSKRTDITGIFATADMLAAGILAGLRDKGVAVPQDKSIVGFDDNYLCQIISPRLTSVHQNVKEKAILATEMIAAQLAGKKIKEKSRILPVHLVARESVRRI